jgi:hypothetical protein
VKFLVLAKEIVALVLALSVFTEIKYVMTEEYCLLGCEAM